MLLLLCDDVGDGAAVVVVASNWMGEDFTAGGKGASWKAAQEERGHTTLTSYEWKQPVNWTTDQKPNKAYSRLLELYLRPVRLPACLPACVPDSLARLLVCLLESVVGKLHGC